MRPARLTLVVAAGLLSVACNADPRDDASNRLGQVGYRDGLGEGEPNSGERGSVKISEVLWSGSVTNDGVHDRRDVFIELRNESARPVNISDWIIEVEGAIMQSHRIPVSDHHIPVGGHAFIAAKATGCFPEPDYVIPDLVLPYDDKLEIVLLDADERLMEPIGNKHERPFAGGYDGRVSRSMERIQVIFGGDGYLPQSWHFYTDVRVDVPNRDKISSDCDERTFASPGRPNSPDYSGAISSGSFD